MSKNPLITKNSVKLIETLSSLKVDKKEQEYFVRQFNETLSVINELEHLKTKNIKPTYQVTGLVNVFRQDIIENERILKQEEALSGSKNIYNGYFVVKAIFK